MSRPSSPPRPLLPHAHIHVHVHPPTPTSHPHPHTHPPSSHALPSSYASAPGIVTRRRLLLLLGLAVSTLLSLVFVSETVYKPPKIPDLRLPADLPWDAPRRPVATGGGAWEPPGSGAGAGDDTVWDEDSEPDESLPAAPRPVSGPNANANAAAAAAHAGPRISLIVIWENGDALSQPSFPYFLQSVRANAPLVELLLVWVRREDEDEAVCEGALAGMDLGEGQGQGPKGGVRLVCLTRGSYWALHRNYFCAGDRWACSDEDAEMVLSTMMARHDLDWYKSFFRIYRGFVFAQYMSKGVDWWGWADQDSIFGDFATQFPWDAKTYDVLIPSLPGDTLLYLRGHLAFFSAHSDTEDKLLQYRNLESPMAYVEKHVPGEYLAMEEAEFSAFIFRNPTITFLSLPDALAHIPSHLFAPQALKFATRSGVFRTHALEPPVTPSIGSMPVLDLRPAPGTARVPARVFSPKGITRPVSIHAGSYEYGLWFPLKYATHYNHFHPIPDGWRRIVGRGGGYRGGEEGVWERLEPPREAVSMRVVGAGAGAGGGEAEGATIRVVEGLYLHWFEEKWNGEWFNNLPPRALLPNQALVTAERHGARIWDMDTGEVVWRGEKVEEVPVGGVDLEDGMGGAEPAEATPGMGGAGQRR